MAAASWPPQCDVAGALIALRDDGQGGQALADLLCFQYLKKWTVALFAARWETSEDTAARALRRLHDRGLLGCLQGEARTAHGAHHGGRGVDVWFLTPGGARVLSAHLGLDPAGRVRAPLVARGSPERTAGGVWKYKTATPQSRTLIAHDLACVAVALREGCFAEDTTWVLRRQVRFAEPHSGAVWALVPDFAIPLRTPARPDYAQPEERFTCYVEVEGTNELPHIAAKHHRYAALTRTLRHERAGGQVYSRAYAAELWLILVLTFGPAERKQRQTVLRRHMIAYANRLDGRNYRLAWIDLADLLAAPDERAVWALAAPIDYEAERERLQAYWNRQPGDADTGDFER